MTSKEHEKASLNDQETSGKPIQESGIVCISNTPHLHIYQDIP
jgi:hypothetical protein